jgi:predicted phage-related endonuclease
MIRQVILKRKSLEYLEKRWLLKQYLKVEEFLLSWKLKQIDFRLREPKKDEIYYFKINKQYRIVWKIIWDEFVVSGIDNHQD